MLTNWGLSTPSFPNSIVEYGAVPAIGGSTETTLLTHVAAGDERLVRVIASGSDWAVYRLYLNAAVVAEMRSSPGLNVYFEMNLPLSLGQVVDVKVEHFQPVTVDCNCTYLGF